MSYFDLVDQYGECPDVYLPCPPRVGYTSRRNPPSCECSYTADGGLAMSGLGFYMTPYGEVLTTDMQRPSPQDMLAMAQKRVIKAKDMGLGAIPGVGLNTIAQSLIDGVTIRTQISPPVTYTADQFLNPPPSIARSFLTEVVKPEVTIRTKAGDVTLAPYGPPDMNLFPVVAGLAAVGFLATGYFVARGIGLIGRS